MHFPTLLLVVCSLLQITFGYRYPMPPEYYNYQPRTHEPLDVENVSPVEIDLNIERIFEILRKYTEDIKELPIKIVGTRVKSILLSKLPKKESIENPLKTVRMR